MESNKILMLCCLSLCIGLAYGDWNIMNHRIKNGIAISLKNYCESWRMNVEHRNIREFEVVPEECVGYISKYVSSTQFKIDSERAVEECFVYLSTSCGFENNGKDAWIFDIDDTLLSNLPFYKKHGFGGERQNLTALEEWMSLGKAPALGYSLRLFNEIKSKGFKIFLISSRRERLRSATIDNLVDVEYHRWTRLILRGSEDESLTVQEFKTKARKALIDEGYHIWGNLGAQFCSIEGIPSAKRSFKLPNLLYHVA